MFFLHTSTLCLGRIIANWVILLLQETWHLGRNEIVKVEGCSYTVTSQGTYYAFRVPGSSVGIATDYGLDCPGSNPSGDEIFRPSRPAMGPTQAPVQWVPGLSLGVKCGRGVLLTTHPLLVPLSWRSRVYLYQPSGPHRARNGITLPLPYIMHFTGLSL